MQYDEALELYDQLVARFPDVQRKGKANPYTSLNGHMFSFLDKQGRLGLRFGNEEQQWFFDNINPEPMISYGATMRGYVVVPDEMLKDTETMVEYFQKSFDYISTLKPKPTTKKKK